MRSFAIRPHVGAFPIVFGMGRSDVHVLLGNPQMKSPPTPWRGICDSWEDGNLQIGYDGELTVTHLGFGPGNYELSVAGSPLWSAIDHPDPNPVLLRLDPDPVVALGFLVFDRIGVTTTGYHEDDESDRAVTVYPRGARDRLLSKGTVPDLSRYRRAT